MGVPPVIQRVSEVSRGGENLMWGPEDIRNLGTIDIDFENIERETHRTTVVDDEIVCHSIKSISLWGHCHLLWSIVAMMGKRRQDFEGMSRPRPKKDIRSREPFIR